MKIDDLMCFGAVPESIKKKRQKPKKSFAHEPNTQNEQTNQVGYHTAFHDSFPPALFTDNPRKQNPYGSLSTCKGKSTY